MAEASAAQPAATRRRMKKTKLAKLGRKLKRQSKVAFDLVSWTLLALTCLAGGLALRGRWMLPARAVALEAVVGAANNSAAFLDIRIDGVDVGRIEVELFDRLAPRTAGNFRRLCAGAGTTAYGVEKIYAGSGFHRIIPGFVAQGGEYTIGRGGETADGPPLDDEWGAGLVRHDRRGLVSMANAGPDTATSQFFFTLAAAPALDGKHVVFGRVRRGLAILDAIEAGGTDTGTPRKRVLVSASGALGGGAAPPRQGRPAGEL